MGALIADCADDCPGHAAHDVGPIAEAPDLLEDGGFVFF
jgi:hypothetical protein